MATNSKIEWTDATWNPVRGCSLVSHGCTRCYAMQVAARFSGPGQAYEGLAYRNSSGAHWTGKVRLVEEHLQDPLKWKKPRRIFVNSMSDLFHEGLPHATIDLVFAVMALSPMHTFQVLTKRAERMREYAAHPSTEARVLKAAALFPLGKQTYERCNKPMRWPLPNVWLGVSVEDQATAETRIPLLLQTPAAVRFISAEPLLAPVDLESIAHVRRLSTGSTVIGQALRGLDWVIVGGESGPKARPFFIGWARDIVAQCEAAGVACFVKQLGACFVVDYYDHEYRDGVYEAQGYEWPEPMGWNTRNGQPPIGSRVRIPLKSRKGGDFDDPCFPSELKVRQFPTPRPQEQR